MIGFSKEEEFYKRIQQHLFEIIPESWKKILFHMSVIDNLHQKPKSELYIYYIPKGFLKRKPVNCYEIPALYDIDEEEYSKLITNLYNVVKLLRDCYKNSKGIAWSTIDIFCESDKFVVEYGFENLLLSNYTSEERHIIWRYKNLNIDLDSLNRKERKVINYYINESENKLSSNVEKCVTPIYEMPSNSIIDYEKSLTLDEIIARDKEQDRIEAKKKKKIDKKRRKKQLDIIEDDTETIINNQILK